MAQAVIMPRQGQSVESCILTEWYKAVGEPVAPGDLLFAYETDKASFEEEAQVEGILLARFFEEGDEVPVLLNVAAIGQKGEDFSALMPATDAGQASDKAADGAAGETGQADAPAKQAEEQDSPAAGSAAVSPRARKLAREKRISLEDVIGSGPGGRLIERDVLAEMEKGKRMTPLAGKKLEEDGLHVPDSGSRPFGKIRAAELVNTAGEAARAGCAGTVAYTDIPLSNVRKIIASAMHASLQQSAQLTHHLSANASAMLQLRREVKSRMKEGYEQNITLNDMVCYAVIRALRKHGAANAHFLDDTVRMYEKIHLGLAVDTERGLLVPTLQNADDLSLPLLSSRLKTLVASAREGSVSPDLLVPEAASFTVSNLGNYGVEMFTPVINLPQVAILGVNTIVQRPTVMPDSSFAFQPFIGLSLTYDHRALDGGPATLFLAEIRQEIEALSSGLL
ncbi:MAG: hypothetical protein CSA96_02965 [Bacteroidetes bacterium]|nr:MAG: hypothetical protein CSA96_02965 [Bacteroidota bacterium]